MQLRLVLREHNSEKARFTVGPGEYVIGRDPKCELVVASDAVSRRHARLTVNESSVFIEDLASANGTYLGDRAAKGRVQLQPGQTVKMGWVVMQAEWDATSFTASVTTVEAPKPPVPEASEESLRGRKYEINDLVASGGMGVIHRARDLHVRRSVAVKLMSPYSVDTPAKRLRFVEEAQVTGQLEHPNIVPVYDLGLDDDGQPFYTMKFVRGITLKVVLDDIRAGKVDTITQFPLARILTIFQKACDAIAFAHSKGVIHRDLKPENIMIGDFGEVLVMDWGLAKTLSGKATTAEPADTFIDSARSSAGAYQTVDGAVLGTPHFMAPEQAAGKIDQLDARTDIFTLGGVLYNILTLEPPFPGTTSKEALQKIHAGIIIPPLEFNIPNPERPSLAHCPDRQIPESLAAVAMKALALHPEHRYQTVRELQKDINAYQGGFATSAEEAGTLKQLVLLLRRRKVEFSLIGIAFIAVNIVGGVALARIIKSERVARESWQRLLNAAPAYASQAESLIDEHKFAEALGRIDTALDLVSDRADFYVLKGNILESLLRLPDARTAYATALKLNSQSEFAQQNLALCEKLIDESAGLDELPATALNELQAAMLRQQRSAEALAMVRRLGKETQTLFDTWKTILEREGLIEKSKNSPRLTLVDAGQFYLNLSRTKTDNIAALKDMPVKELNLMFTDVRDLSPLKGAPVAVLNLAGTPVSDLEPLRGMPLKVLILTGCKDVIDLTPLCDCPQLETIFLPPEPGNLDCLRNLPKLTRIAGPLRFGLVREELARRLGRFEGPSRGMAAFMDETQPAISFWKEYHPTTPPAASGAAATP